MVQEVVSTSLWAAWALVSIVVALAGPFGTFDSQPFLWRLTYWSGLIAAAIVISIFCRFVVRNLFQTRAEWQEHLAVAFLLSVTFGPLVILLNRIVGGAEAYQAMGLFAAIGCIFAISLSVILLRRAIVDPNSEAAPATRKSDRLLGRISAEDGTRIMRISSDNHHTRITTDDGVEHRVLMRLGDAVKEADVEPGMCVHRSHWVAEFAVVSLKRADGRDMVELIDGTILPVGPKYRSNLDHLLKISA